jgi:hypothetical protein
MATAATGRHAYRGKSGPEGTVGATFRSTGPAGTGTAAAVIARTLDGCRFVPQDNSGEHWVGKSTDHLPTTIAALALAAPALAASPGVDIAQVYGAAATRARP